MSGKYVRVIRVDDKTWTKAQRIAEANGTTMSGMIARYLKGLKETSHIGDPWVVAMEKGRHKPIGKANSPRRAIWVPDTTWEKIHRIAGFHQTTVTAIIVRWLRSLDEHSVIKKAGDTPRRYTPDGRRTKLVLPNPERVFVDASACPHPEDLRKVIMGHEFCAKCSTRMEKP